MKKRSRAGMRLIAGMISGLQVLALCAALPVSARVELNTNILSDRTLWKMYADSSASATYVAYKTVSTTITDTGTYDYSVQVYYNGVPMYQNGEYTLTFEISSTVPRNAAVMIQENGGDYTSYMYKSLSLTEETQEYQVDFKMTNDTDLTSKLVFNCGDTGTEMGEHTITISNAELKLVNDDNVDYSAFEIPEKKILLNQVGYLPDVEKVAVCRGLEAEESFSVCDAVTNEVVYTGMISNPVTNSSASETDWYADFSAVTTEGTYYINSETCGKSDTFAIGESVYSDLTNDMVRMFYLQRCGTAVEDETFSHPVCHTQKTVDYETGESMDVTGGWHDAGDYGRYVTAGAKAVADLLWAYRYNPDIFTDTVGIPESGNGVPDVLDEVRYELEWMKKMQDEETGGVHHKVTCKDFPGYVMPQFETATLLVTPVSSLATADFAAVMAMASEMYAAYDETFAQDCLACAEWAWKYLENNPNLVFENPSDISTGTYADYEDEDERFWAAAQMYEATGEQKYIDAMNQLSSVSASFDWSTIGGYGYLTMLNLTEEQLAGSDSAAQLVNTLQRKLNTSASSLQKISESNAYGTSITKYNWGSNMTISNNGFLMAVAGMQNDTGDQAMQNAAYDQLNYLLGTNPTGYCFVSGYGTTSPEQPHHRPSMAKRQAMKGMLAGGVNQNLEDDIAKVMLVQEPIAKRYLDNWESYSTNEIAIYWNSSMVFLLAILTNDDVQSQPEPVRGDQNEDNVLNGLDITLLRQEIQSGSADASATDMVWLVKFLLQITEE